MNSTVKNKEKLQNTKKIKDIVKRFSILSLSLIFTLMSFSFCFADTSPFSINYGSLDNLSNYTFDSLYTFGYTNQSNGNANVIKSDSNLNAYFCLVTSEGYPLIVVENIDGLTNVNIQYSNNFNGSSRGNYPVSNFTLDETTGLYYYQDWNATFSTTWTYLCPRYDSRALALAAVKDVIDSSSGDTIRYPYTFQNGYLFVYDLGSSDTMYSFDLSSKSEEYSNIGSNPFPDTNQSYWFSNNLPEIDETNIPSTSAAIIVWQKGDKTNIFGQTQDMKTTINGTSTGRYLYIYNPPAHYKWSGSSNPTASEVVNYPLTINGISSGDNFYIYDSAARLYDYNQGGKVEGTIVGETGYGSVSTDGAISVTTTDGAIYNQTSGGSTDISGATGGSISENIRGLQETLDNFVNQFIQLLSAPISHIQQLIQSSHQFFDVFSQLFEWLPSELSSVIVSGLIIMVVIGVIKMLL